jgi:ABC-type transport system involved in multi-copper enzyme maturation permease subunit
MSSTTLPHTGDLRVEEGPAPTVPFTRLAAVELRKLADTRTALVLLTLLVLSAVGAMVVNASFFTPGVQDVATSAALTLGLFLPVLGIVSVTSEWNKRTALTTFALEPRRWRVLVAKAVAAAAVAVATSALMIALAYPTTAVAAAVRGTDAHLALDPVALAGWTAVNVLFTLCGIALGAMLLNAAASIVVYFVASIAWGFLGLTGDLGSTLAGWLDLNVTSVPLADGEMSAHAVGPLLASIGLWVAGPFLLGLLRMNRMELR